ncbi:MAG TPA: hypothetical protein VGT44_17240 [Ktedonobacteraceae bacterium]|nr:hypothetical protein [Ktedonobacteraceae bacterium]
MKTHTRLLLLLSLLAGIIAACSPGHLGGSEIAFVRDGRLWTIDPDGANAFEVVAATSPVIGYAWSPDHHMFVFRQLDRNSPGKSSNQTNINPLLGVPGDLPASLNTIGLDGGSPIQIIPSIAGLIQSNAWWNTSGTRLLYREITTNQSNQQPIDAQWWVSQNDQPGGIARKSLPYSFSIPSFASDSSLAIGNSSQGIFTTTLAGDGFHLLVPGALPGHPLPAALERLLWQPAHTRPALLYAILSPSSPSQPSSPLPPAVDLVLRNADGQVSPIARCACTQFAWSPDGNSILYSTGAAYTIYTLTPRASFAFSAEAGSVPYWSPDSRFILLDGPHTLTLLATASHQQQLLLSDGSAVNTVPSMPDATALLQPASNNLWATDSLHFLLLTRGRTLWQNRHLASGNGLYVATIDSAGHIQGSPTLIDSGNDTQPGWSYEDPNTSFLF